MRNNLHEGSEIQIYLRAFKEEIKFIDHSLYPFRAVTPWLMSFGLLQLKLVCPAHSFLSQMSGPQSTGHIPAFDDAPCFMLFL